MDSDSGGWSPDRNRGWSPDRDRYSPEWTRDGPEHSPSRSPARDSNLIGMGKNPRGWSQEPSSTGLMPNEEIHQLREYLSRIGNESGGSDANLFPARYREPRGVGSDLQQWSERLMSTSSISNAELEQLRECLINVGNESGRERGSQGEQHGGQGDGNGGGDGGNRVVHDGYDSSSDEDDKNGSDAQKMRESAADLEKGWDDRTFRSAKRFAEHYNGHAKEWSPTLTEEQYLAKARELLSAPTDANIEGFISESGKFIYKYNNATNEFAIGMADGVISTFYKPKIGRAYCLEEIENNGGPHVFGGK